MIWALRFAITWNNTKWHVRTVARQAARRPLTTAAVLLIILGLVLGTGALYIHNTPATATASPQARRPVATAPVHARKPAPAPVPAVKYVTVQSGQSLWSIAAQYLGSGSRWMAIWKLNRNEIPDPSALNVGEKIKL